MAGSPSLHPESWTCSVSSPAGEPNKQIAAELGISERTARTHVSRILRKLHLSSRTQAALWAVGEGLVEVERELR